MQKILELSSKEWSSGIGVGEFLSAGVLSDDTNGATGNSADSTARGLLVGGHNPLDIASTVVTGKVWAGVIGEDPNASVTKLWTYDDDGDIYEQSNVLATPTSMRGATHITTPANGLAIYQPKGGTRYLYYARTTAIGRWNMDDDYDTTPGDWDDTWQNSGINSTTEHPMYTFFDRVYIGNDNSIAEIKDDGANGETFTANVLDFEDSLTCNTLSGDGTYLIVGAKGKRSSTIDSRSKILFWDTFSNSWQREYTLPEPIISIQKVGSIQYALTTNRLYAFNFSNAPIIVAESGVSNSDNTHHRTDKYRDGVVWCDTSGNLRFYGKMWPDGSKTLEHLMTGLTGANGVFTVSDSQITVGGDGTFYAQLPKSEGGGNSQFAETNYIDLNGRWHIKMLSVYLGNDMGSGDDLDIDLLTDSGTEIDWGDLTFSADGAIKRKKMYNSATADQIKLQFNFDGGNVRVKKVEVWGEKIKDES